MLLCSMYSVMIHRTSLLVMNLCSEITLYWGPPQYNVMKITLYWGPPQYNVLKITLYWGGPQYNVMNLCSKITCNEVIGTIHIAKKGIIFVWGINYR